MSTYQVDTSAIVERPVILNTDQYRVAELLIPNIPNDSAAGAGQEVEVNVEFVTDTDFAAVLPSDENYTVEVTPSQACAAWVSDKTTTGFLITLTPLASGVTLSAGGIDVKVLFPTGGSA
jgi:hypothetical protein